MFSSSMDKISVAFRSSFPVVRRLSSSVDSPPFKEIRIPVPWGHIAGKEWGKHGGRPLLGIHGWQDNSATFDLLAPHLPEDVHFLAIDLPGHGLSSHIPSGFFYDMVSYVGYVRRVIKHLAWDQFSILGHSMGAIIAVGYAGCYPEQVRKMAVLDIVQFYMMPTPILTSFVARRIDQMVDMSDKDNTSSPRTYTMDEIVQRLVESTGDFMTEASARILLKRGSRPVQGEDGSSRVVLTRDSKLRLSLPIASEDQVLAIRENVRCDLLLVLATNGLSKKYPEEVVQEVLDIHRKRARTFRLEIVEGTHHVHLNNSERVIPILKDYFSS